MILALTDNADAISDASFLRMSSTCATSSMELGIDVGECTADEKFSLEACRCIGACGLAPVLTVNDEVYGRLTVDDVDTILAKYAD